MTATATRKKAASPSARSNTSKRPTLRVVDKQALRRRARRRVLVTLAAGLIATGLFAVALVYAQLAQGQQDIDTMRTQISESESEIARLEHLVVSASSPSAVVARATELGMVRAENPIYLTAVESTGPGQTPVSVPLIVDEPASPESQLHLDSVATVDAFASSDS